MIVRCSLPDPPRWTAALLCALALAPAGVAAEEAPAPTERLPVSWTQSTRDVYVDGRAEPGAVVWEAAPPERLAVVLPDHAEAIVLEEDGTVGTLPRDLLVLEAPRLATSPAPEPRPGDARGGSWVEVADGGLFGRIGDLSVLVLPHRGLAGPLEAADLWTADPSWKALASQWADRLGRPGAEAETAAVASLAALEEPVELEILFGTWCGDSRRSVPKLLAALERADNPRITTRLVAIRRGFTEPLEHAISRRVTNVPTVVVRRDDEEIGRFVETPRSESVVTDLAAILEGEPVPPREKAADSDRWVAAGRYAAEGADESTPHSEEWSLFETSRGEVRLHSVLRSPTGATTEVWQRFASPSGPTEFLEVTREASGETTRTRLSARDGGKFTSLTRGDASGIVEQLHAPPEGTLILGPGAASLGLSWPRGDAERRGILRVPGAGEGFAARLSELRVDVVGDDPLEVFGELRPASRFRIRTDDGRETEMWIDEELGVPLLVRRSDGSGARLVELQLP